MWGIRVIIPQSLRNKLLQELHQDHPGVTRMKSVARSYMWWPGLDKELETLAKSCQSCQAVKQAPSAAPLHPWVWPSRPWQRVHLDFAGPFQGHMFLVGVDAYSKWPEVRVMSTTTVTKTLDVLREWFAAHGIPEHVVTDNGPQFVADEFDTFTKRNGIKHVKSAPYHPASNGLAERFIQSLKQSLRASVNDGRSLSQRISTYLLTYRTTAHSTTGVPPCKLFVQRDLRTRFTLLQPDTEKIVVDRQAHQKATHDRHSRQRQWSVGDRVLARNHRPGPDWIPSTVVEVLGPVTYTVETDEGHRWKRHADQIKSWISPPRESDRPQAEPESTSDTDLDPLPEDSTPMDSETPETAETTVESPPELAPATADSGPASESTPPDTGVAAHPASETSERRYPGRSRQPPDFYQPHWC